MGKKDKKRDRRVKDEPVFHYSELPPVDISLEKRKARKLRHSAWWKRRIAGGECYYCGQRHDPAELTMDHKIPLARGGTSQKENIVPCCKECNSQKKYKLPAEWSEYLEGVPKK